MSTVLRLALDNAFVALILAPCIALVSLAFRRPALAHALWLIVLLRLLAPPLLSGVPLPFPGLADSLNSGTTGLFGPAEWAHQAVEKRVSIVLEGLGALIVGGLWIAGSVLWLLLSAQRLRRFRCFLECAGPASYELQNHANELAKRLGLRRAPEVWMAASRVAPMIWAAGRSPRLILPASLWDALAPPQRDALLVHELAHLGRRDHWVRILEVVVTAAYWWHPAVWWARWRLHEAEEQCCDAWVNGTLPGSARSYASALLATVDFLSEVRTPVPVVATGLGGGRHFRHLHRRLTRIMAGARPDSLTKAALPAVVLLAVLTLRLSMVRTGPAPSQLAVANPTRWLVVDDPRQPNGKRIVFKAVRQQSDGSSETNTAATVRTRFHRQMQ